MQRPHYSRMLSGFFRFASVLIGQKLRSRGFPCRDRGACVQAAGRLDELMKLGADLRAGLIADAVRQIR